MTPRDYAGHRSVFPTTVSGSRQSAAGNLLASVSTRVTKPACRSYWTSKPEGTKAAPILKRSEGRLKRISAALGLRLGLLAGCISAWSVQETFARGSQSELISDDPT